MDYKSKEVGIDGNRTKLQVWDTAGQERFRNITSGKILQNTKYKFQCFLIFPVNIAYMRGAQGILMVYDVCDATSFEHVKHWMDKINEIGTSTVQVLLIGNKCDDSENRVIQSTRGEKLAKTYNVEFLETSALDGQNINTAFMRLAAKCINSIAGVNNETSPVALTNPKKRIRLENCC